jgi:putative tryptophan/tyrosine transport system substrate-binding protein
VINRRTFLAGSGAVLLAAPLAAEAQPAGKVYRMGVIVTSTPSPAFARLWDAFSNELRKLGYVEGKNILVERRYSEGQAELYPQLAADLVGLKVDLIMVVTTPAALAAKAATATIPILFVTAIDPVGAGLAASLARPGGNVTGLATLSPELSTKRLELTKELIPRVSRVAVLWNAGNPANAVVRPEIDAAARRLGLVLRSYEVQRPDDFASTFAAIVRERPEALLVPSDALMFQRREQIAQLALQARLPAIFEPREMAVAGGLMAYGPSYAEMFRRAAFYVDKLLKGIKPADLPFEQPTQFELVINLKTAKALGLTIPPSLLGRADEVIQ